MEFPNTNKMHKTNIFSFHQKQWLTLMLSKRGKNTDKQPDSNNLIQESQACKGNNTLKTFLIKVGCILYAMQHTFKHEKEKSHLLCTYNANVIPVVKPPPDLDTSA